MVAYKHLNSNFFFFMHMSVLPAGLSVHRVYRRRLKEGITTRGTGVIDSYELNVDAGNRTQAL